MVTIVEWNVRTGHKEVILRMEVRVAYRRNHAERLANAFQRQDHGSDHAYVVCREE